MTFQPKGDRAIWESLLDCFSDKRWGTVVRYAELLSAVGANDRRIVNGAMRRAVKEVKKYGFTIASIYGVGYRIVPARANEHEHYTERTRQREWMYRNFPSYNAPWDTCAEEYWRFDDYLEYGIELMGREKEAEDLWGSPEFTYEKWGFLIATHAHFKSVKKEYREGIIRSIRSGGSPESLFRSLIPNGSVLAWMVDTGDLSLENFPQSFNGKSTNR
jgi:hypothetical protein